MGVCSRTSCLPPVCRPAVYAVKASRSFDRDGGQDMQHTQMPSASPSGRKAEHHKLISQATRLLSDHAKPYHPGRTLDREQYHPSTPLLWGKAG